MNRPLAVFSPDEMGLAITTFIRRHMEDLLPGRTVAVAPLPAGWRGSPGLPVLDLRQIVGGRLRWQAAHGFCRQFGWKLDHWMIQRFLRRHGVEVIMAEHLDTSVQWLDIARNLGIRFFAHAHGDDVILRLRDPAWQKAYLQYHKADGIITMSEFGRQELIQFGLDPARLHTVPCCVDVPAAPFVREDRPEVCCIAVGRITTQKAPIMLLDAFRRAAAECPELRLEVFGEGPLMPALQDFVRAFDLGERVQLLGVQPNEVVLEHMRRADIFVQHSWWEGLGVAILEAMAQTLPVVATRTGGILETVVEGSTGYLVEPGDSAGMAERIVELAGNAAVRCRLGRAGWERVRDHFTWERERSELLRVLGLAA
jgi:glycosyltransferase involved in cell wall biosynthesis